MSNSTTVEIYNNKLDNLLYDGNHHISNALNLRDIYHWLYHNDTEAFNFIHNKSLPQDFIDKLTYFNGNNIDISKNTSKHYDGTITYSNNEPITIGHIFGIQHLGPFEIPFFILANQDCSINIEKINYLKNFMKI